MDDQAVGGTRHRRIRVPFSGFSTPVRRSAAAMAADLELALIGMRWYRGHTPAGDPVLIAWINLCPLEIRLDRDGTGAYTFVVHGHCTGVSPAVAGAARDAVAIAVERGSDGSDSRWLRGTSAKRGFFGHHGVDPKVDPYLSTDDLQPTEAGRDTA